jgi:putative secretion ATPase (PEP-CTERM system associated)
MYEAFYGLTGKPFQLNPDPSFYFGSRQHRRAMAYLEYGLHQNEGFIVVTGEVGAGKTTLVRSLFGQLDSSKVIAANLVSTQLDADDMLRMVAAAFGIPTKNTEKSDLLLAIEAYLVSTAAKNKRCLLVVDEAQNLTPQAVEELRMLSNFQLKTHALLQSFLIGQPEFRAILQSPEMQQLRQRVIASCHIGPMDEDETRGYIEHRLKHVGWKDNPQFQPSAFKEIFGASRGIPRRINSVCDRLLLCGFLAEKREFGQAEVAEVAEEFEQETRGPNASGRDVVPALSELTIGNLSTVQLELLQKGVDSDAIEDASRLIRTMGQEDLAERLVHLESSLLRLERNMLRLESRNSASLVLLNKLIDYRRSGATEADDKLE